MGPFERACSVSVTAVSRGRAGSLLLRQLGEPGALAEFERDLIRDRVRSGISRVKATGRTRTGKAVGGRDWRWTMTKSTGSVSKAGAGGRIQPRSTCRRAPCAVSGARPCLGFGRGPSGAAGWGGTLRYSSRPARSKAALSHYSTLANQAGPTA